MVQVNGINGGVFTGTSGYRSNCQNCGHPSHCGVKLQELTCIDGVDSRIDICPSCSCDKCASLVGYAESRVFAK